MDIIQVGLLGITAVFLALFIKNYKSEYSILISIVACICIFIFLIGKLEIVLSYINSVVELIPVDGRYLAMILKMIGITYVAEFATDICRESGYQAIAGQIEIFAKLSILLISHDLALVQHLCDRVIVMYQGNIVEQGTPDRVINAPENDYTKMLIEAAMLGQ